MVSFFLKAFTVLLIVIGIYAATTIKDIPLESREEIFLLYFVGVIPLFIFNIFAEIEDENRTP